MTLDCYARAIRSVSPDVIDCLSAIARDADWKHPGGKHYRIAEVTGLIDASLFGETGLTRAQFLKIPPGGSVQRHVDVAVRTLHVPIQSNALSWSCWVEGEVERRMRLVVGEVYEITRTMLHWAENHGSNDRIHLIAEF